MLRVILIGAALLIGSGCASTPSRYEGLSGAPTPEVWRRPGAWQFHFVDVDRNWLGAIVLNFLDEPTETCSSGDWKYAEVLSSTDESVGLSLPVEIIGGLHVAYQIHGALLQMDLNGNVCDSNNLVLGQLLETGAVGRVDYSHMLGGEQIGWFTAAPASR